MNKSILIFFVLSLVPVAAYAAGCEYYSGYAESDEYSFYVVNTDSCPTNYVETTEFIVVDNSAACPDGYIDTPEYGDVVCDSARGTCGTGYTCPAP